MTTLSLIAAMAVMAGIPRAAAREAIDFKRLLEEMLDRSEIAEFPRPEFVCKQASSYNRLSKTPGNPDWFVGGDFCQFYGSNDVEGRKEWFMLDVEGPAVVTRWWLTQYRYEGTIRIYLDGAKEPIFEGTGDKLVGGNGITVPPLAAVPIGGHTQSGDTIPIKNANQSQSGDTIPIKCKSIGGHNTD
jgi:hypothetical protein